MDKNDKIDELFELINAKSVISEIEEANKVPEVSLEDRFMNAYISSTVQERIIKEVKTLFETLLTDEEIDGILDFYKSNAGQALLKKFPIINREAMRVGQKVTEEMMSDDRLETEFELWKSVVNNEKTLH